MILLLNLLIALMGNSYSIIQGKGLAQWRLEQAKIIIEQSFLLSESELNSNNNGQIYFPKSIYLLKRVADVEQNIDELKKNNSSKNVFKDELIKLELMVVNLETKHEESTSEWKKSIKEIQMKMDNIISVMHLQYDSQQQSNKNQNDNLNESIKKIIDDVNRNFINNQIEIIEKIKTVDDEKLKEISSLIGKTKTSIDFDHEYIKEKEEYLNNLKKEEIEKINKINIEKEIEKINKKTKLKSDKVMKTSKLNNDRRRDQSERPWNEVSAHDLIPNIIGKFNSTFTHNDDDYEDEFYKKNEKYVEESTSEYDGEEDSDECDDIYN